MTTPPLAALPVQGALLSKLTADQALSDLVTGVWDNLPEDAPFPYIKIGEATEIPDNTHSGYGRATTHTLHVWSQYPGYAQALQIATRLVEVLDHQPLAVSGLRHIVTRFEFLQTLTDPEPPGDIRHVPMRFRVVTATP